ncbi:MAG: AAA family ATPase [Bacteroidales bacterium]|nr:AAA family ATPase [Bacteroidales bacterium]
MRIFIHDTFQDALLDLSRDAQKKVNAFIKKLRTCTSTNGMHLEPIDQFRDGNLRTARVDDNYRAVVGLLDGDVFLLYVAKHDVAYKWGERKKLAWNDPTQTCQLFTMVEETVPTPSPQTNTTEEAGAFANIGEDKLLKIGVPDELPPIVVGIKDLDELEKIENILPTDTFERLFYLIDGGDIDSIVAEIEEGTQADGDKLLSGNNRRRFFELTDDEELQRIIEDENFEKWQIFLHPSQRKLVDAKYSGTMKVSGGAGTGKTIAAIHRLKHLASQPNAKVLFTTYTKALRSNLEELINRLGIDKTKYTLNNIDQVLLDVARTYHIKDNYQVTEFRSDFENGRTSESLHLWREILETEVSEFDENFLYDEYIYVILYYGNTDAKQYMTQQRVGRTRALSRKQKLEIWRLVEKYVALKEQRKMVDRLELFNEVAQYLNGNDIRPYTNVIADEFQDFSNPELKFLRALVKEGENDLFLTGDPLQRVYSGRKMNFSAAGINVRGFRSKRLKVNYRTTEPIKRVAVAVVKGGNYDDLDGGTEPMTGYVSLIRGGEKPIYKMSQNATDEVDAVMGWLEECKVNGITDSDICIAAPKMDLLKDVQTRLHRNGQKYQVIKGRKQGDKDGISLCTFHSLKGLEFKVVILVGVNERYIPSVEADTYQFMGKDKLEKKEYLSEIRSLLYVAITRARQLVFMTGFGTPCGLVKALLD